MKLEPIAQHLVTEDVAEQGVDLFIYNMPSGVEIGILLISSLSGTEIDYELPGFKRTSFQAIVRHTEFVEGRELADLVSSTLTLKNGTMLDNLLVRYIRPRHEPVVYPVSEGDYLEFSINFDAVYIET
tara:strand:- start:33162 stop:33545 length:384 start_codon:yes stop_codon:yes gene_type:complete